MHAHARAPARDDGVGLAAPQVGVNVRLMVFNPFGRDKPGEESILANPEIVESLPGKELGQEGCLSFPQIYGDLEVRPVRMDTRACVQAGARACGGVCT
jgi:peptide deformylase